ETALGDLQDLPRLGQITQHLTGVVINHRGSNRHLQGDIRTLGPGAVTPHTVLSAFRPIATLIAVIDQGVDAVIRHQKYRAAIPAISPAGPPHRGRWRG